MSHKGEHEDAIKDLNEAIRLNPSQWEAYFNRSADFMDEGRLDEAIVDLRKVTDLNPNFVPAYARRATLYVRKKQYLEAKHDLDQVNRLHPKDPAGALNSVAWLRATLPDPVLRNGKKAIEEAHQACELSSWKEWGYIDTLAAAYAEAGDFAQAIKYQKQALQIAPGNDERVMGAKQRLQLYEQHKPYREEPKN